MIAIALAVAACSGTGTGTGIGTATTASTEVTRTSDVPNATTTAPNTTTTAPPAAPGRLVVIDGSGDVVTMRPDGSDLRRLTDDGGVVEYRQPLWSPSDRRLLWSETTAAGFALVLFDQGSVISISMPALPFFSMWAPDGTRRPSRGCRRRAGTRDRGRFEGNHRCGRNGSAVLFLVEP